MNWLTRIVARLRAPRGNEQGTWDLGFSTPETGRVSVGLFTGTYRDAEMKVRWAVVRHAMTMGHAVCGDYAIRKVSGDRI